MKKISFAIIVIMMSMALNFKTAKAESFTFNYSNAFGTGSYGTVDIVDLGDALQFTLTANESYFGTSGLVWDKFYFNSPTDDISMGIPKPSGTWDVTTDKNVSEFGWFDYEVNGNKLTANNPLAFTVVDGTPFSISDVTIPNSDEWMFAAHLRGFDAIEGQTSTFLAVGPSPVPEPATMLLFGTGLVGLVGFNRKRKK